LHLNRFLVAAGALVLAAGPAAAEVAVSARFDALLATLPEPAIWSVLALAIGAQLWRRRMPPSP